MALTQKQRDERTALKRQKAGEEELRLRVRPGTKQALAELMEWAGIEEQGEALTLMIHHLHELGPGGAIPLLEVPRHEITVSKIVALEFHHKSMLMIHQDPGCEIISPAMEANRLCSDAHSMLHDGEH
ncbi:hypothetical protein [Pseudomonas syringae pv. coryli]|uniref:hypothetical protein n=1 Tax=Pseudomonas syringae pv. coryli TaxID=317659 RepID=UPI003D2726C0